MSLHPLPTCQNFAYNLFKFCIHNQHCSCMFKVNMSTRVKILLVTFWNFGIPKSCEVKDVALWIFFSLSIHHYKGDFRSLAFITIWWYKDNSIFIKKRNWFVELMFQVSSFHKESSMLGAKRGSLCKGVNACKPFGNPAYCVSHLITPPQHCLPLVVVPPSL